MKEPLNVGDRVAVYGLSQMGLTSFERKKGTVTKIFSSNEVYVRIDGNKDENTFHVKQVRRLKKKKRMELWIWMGRQGEVFSAPYTNKDSGLLGKKFVGPLPLDARLVQFVEK